jgi:uroporphyrinogen-III synthase
MRVIVTRPAQEAARWVTALGTRGISAMALPLIDIVPAPDAQAVQRAWRDLGSYSAAMFVSPNAVQAFFAARGAHGWPAHGVRAWAPGPGTRDALVAEGVPAASIDAPAQDAAQFDSEHLWARVQGQLAAGSRVLLVRGADAGGRGQGREWLAQRLAEAGVAVEDVAAYARQRPAWDASQVQAARAAGADGSLWLFSSSEAVDHLAQLVPGFDWRSGRALVTHPRIAERARSLGFGRVETTRPALEEVVASIESMRC